MEAWVTWLPLFVLVLPHTFAYLFGRDYHCGLIGYQVKKHIQVSATSAMPSNITVPAGIENSHKSTQCFPVPVGKIGSHGRSEQSIPKSQGKSREGN